MDIRKIKKLIELLEDSDLAEIEIRQGEEAIRISRNSSAAAVHYAPAPAPAPAAPAPEPVAAAPAEPAAPAGHPVKSPMVGTFYSAATPEAKPFVDVGSVVSVGDTLCIIEAMKIFNEIEADRAGKIVAVMKSNGEAVEYGEPLFFIG